ncbi:MAG: hypothetical protein IPP40_10345 [bacterium]|nr:hypothetical protein [bacterium]
MKFMKSILLVIALVCANVVFAQWDINEAETLTFTNGPVGKNLVVDGEGNVHAVFRAGNSVMYYVRSAQTNQWTAGEAVTDSASMGSIGEVAIDWDWQTSQPAIAFQSNNRVWAATRDEGNMWLRMMMGDPNEDAYSPDVAVNPAGMAYVVYITDDAGVYQLGYGYYDGETWARRYCRRSRSFWIGSVTASCG